MKDRVPIPKASGTVSQSAYVNPLNAVVQLLKRRAQGELTRTKTATRHHRQQLLPVDFGLPRIFNILKGDLAR
jgi:hypothetical protein